MINKNYNYGTNEDELKKKRLPKEEWNQLDRLISKIGFGGYYDLCETIKSAIEDLNFKLKVFKCEKIRKESDLSRLLEVLNYLSNKIRKEGEKENAP